MAKQRAVALSTEALAMMSAPIYAALIGPWAQLVATDGGKTKALELQNEALRQAQVLHEMSEAVLHPPPVNVDVPHISQTGDTLNCTTGNWEGEPLRYGYQWRVDGTEVGTSDDSYTVQTEDVGKTATCVVTAENATGATAAPVSNALVIEEYSRNRRHR